MDDLNKDPSHQRRNKDTSHQVGHPYLHTGKFQPNGQRFENGCACSQNGETRCFSQISPFLCHEEGRNLQRQFDLFSSTLLGHKTTRGKVKKDKQKLRDKIRTPPGWADSVEGKEEQVPFR